MLKKIKELGADQKRSFLSGKLLKCYNFFMNKQILFSGVRPTGQPHLGNYLGAIKQFVDLQNDYECFFSIVDLHALTTPFEPKELRAGTLEITATYLAAGLDPKKVVVFPQSLVSQHAELAWIFNCITPLSELYRMTQFKEKSEQHKESVNAGLLDYPVLMAADILLYKTQAVPVGEDQVQHVELARIIARKFNNRFGKVFPEPKPILSKALRIKSLSNPEKKMSKTGDEALLLADSPAEIHRKLKKAVTSTDSGGKAPGVENLMLLLREFGTKEQIQYFDNAISDQTIRYSELKETLAERIAASFAPFREKRAELLANPELLATILEEGADRARRHAKQTLSEVRKKIGLL